MSGERHAFERAANVLPLVRRLVDARPTYGYRRVTALVNRELAAMGEPPVNHKRIYRLMKIHGLLLERHSGRRPGRVHDGKVVVMRSNMRSPVGSNQWRHWLTARTASSSPAGTARSSGPHSTIVLEPMANKVSFIDAHDRESIA